jgi:transposase
MLDSLDEAGNRVWRGRCATDPAAIAATVRRYAPSAARIGLETGPLTTWLRTALTAEGLPVVCLDARHAKKALDMTVNKTDANDAEGLKPSRFHSIRPQRRRALSLRTRVSTARDRPQQVRRARPSSHQRPSSAQQSTPPHVVERGAHVLSRARSNFLRKAAAFWRSAGLTFSAVCRQGDPSKALAGRRQGRGGTPLGVGGSGELGARAS